jgi:hypothetical protein
MRWMPANPDRADGTGRSASGPSLIGHIVVRQKFQ